MTGALDTTARALAGRLIDKYGKALSFSLPAGAYNPTTDSTSGALGPYSWNGVLDKYERAYPNGNTEKHGTTLIYVPLVNSAGTAATFALAPGWTVTIDSEVYRITSVSEIKSGEQGAMWELEVAK